MSYFRTKIWVWLQRGQGNGAGAAGVTRLTTSSTGKRSGCNAPIQRLNGSALAHQHYGSDGLTERPCSCRAIAGNTPIFCRANQVLCSHSLIHRVDVHDRSRARQWTLQSSAKGNHHKVRTRVVDIVQAITAQRMGLWSPLVRIYFCSTVVKWGRQGCTAVGSVCFAPDANDWLGSHKQS